MRLNGDGITALPTYAQLRPLLASMPGAMASHETVARAMMVLRLTRWLSLVRRRRDPRTGRILGNLYVLHDEPLTPYEAIQLDPTYLPLVSQALTHAGKSVQRVGFQVLKEMSEDPHLAGRVLPNRLHLLMRRMRDGEAYPRDETYPQEKARGDSEESRPDSEEGQHESEEGEKTLSSESETPASDSEEGPKTLLRNRKPPASDSEAGPKPAPDGLLRNPEQESTVRTVLNNNDLKVRTVPRARELGLQLPERFLALKEEQQAGGMIALQQVDETQRQAVLDEWAARCGDSRVRNPAGYLYGIVQKAIRGEFKAWAAQNTPTAGVVTAGKADEPGPPADPEAVREHLKRLHSILHRPPGSRP
jgi:hypothetical protein